MTRLVAAALAVAIALTGCDFVTRKHEAQVLVDAAKNIERAKTGTGSLAISLKRPEVSSGLGVAVPVPSALSVAPMPLQFGFADRSAHAGVAPGLEAVFTGPIVFFKRPVTAADTENQFGFRAWSRLDFSKIKRKDKNSLGSVNLANPVNPVYLVRLLAGTLSGSVKKEGSEVVGGVRTTHYRMNVDRAKAFSRLTDKDRQALEHAFRSNNIKGSVFKDAEAWIGADGLPRRLILRVHQKFTIKPARDLAVDVVFPITYTIELSNFGAPVKIAAPSPDSTAEVTSLNALLEGARS